ncbi:MAG: S9 family peptidase [Gemmataceae bacterium]|jgi:dipeptidyl aminopeptidase/acylaminoacyl peptidase
MDRFFFTLLGLITILGMTATVATAARPMQVDDLFKFLRVSDAQISPDGFWIAYVVTKVDLDANKSSSNLWLADVAGKNPPKRLTSTDKKDRHPRWSPDGKRILFESSRSGENQLWTIDIRGGEARQITNLATEASGAIWSADGKNIAFVSAVYPEFAKLPFKESDAANKKKMDEIKASPIKAKVFTKLFYRHWDSYVEDKRQHLFVLPFDNNGTEGFAEPRDVTPGDRDAFPTSSTFSSGDDFTFSPDGKYLVFSAVPEKDEAWSTNMDLCRVSINNTSDKWENLTKENLAADSAPMFSPDGNYLAYRAQKRPGFEADKWEIMIVETNQEGTFKSKPVSFTGALKTDVSVNEFTWAGKDKILFTADHLGKVGLFQILPLEDVKAATLIKNQMSGYNSGISASTDGAKIAFLNASMASPPEVFAGNADLRLSKPINISKVNETLLTELELPKPESVTLPGAGDTPTQMWILKPPGFDPSKKWPVAFLVHGGPQGAWEDGWSYRWNPQAWAARGYVVALPNPRGSTGFGQKYVDEISGDWGGKCYEDLMKAADYVEKLPYVDKDRIGSAGASFGGYMMNWFSVKTSRFKCLISHCGVYNFESMYTTTEEIWFDEWEHSGPPWGKGGRESYEKFSPHRFAENLAKFKTPMLIIHNDLDFRVPISEGTQIFTALQRQGVPSRFVNFPDEGHWVLKPKNSQFWYKEVFTWLEKYVPPGGR